MLGCCHFYECVRSEKYLCKRLTQLGVSECGVTALCWLLGVVRFSVINGYGA